MATTQSREMSDEHKAALATGRAQSRAVKAYLEALKTNKPKRGRKRTTESITKRLEVIADELNSADALQEVQLLQEQTDLQTELESFDQQIDMSALERDFVANAAPYSASKGITYGTWRRVGVSADLLREAGIPR